MESEYRTVTERVDEFSPLPLDDFAAAAAAALPAAAAASACE